MMYKRENTFKLMPASHSPTSPSLSVACPHSRSRHAKSQPSPRISSSSIEPSCRNGRPCFRNLFTISFGTSFAVLLFICACTRGWTLDEFIIDKEVIKNMVRTFGRELSSVSTEQTCLARIEENFQSYSQEVSWFDGNKMMDDMRMDVMNMLNWKKHAVERIANESERLAANHTYDKNIEIDYFNVKRIHDDSLGISPKEEDSRSIRLLPHPNFDNAFVNLENSAIHVPINVYEKSPDIINDIKWSEALTPFFKNNLAFDPSLSWQFFGSAKGFLRLYPATPWKMAPEYSDKPQVDFYDSRLRPWYIHGAASPKDIVILLDTSGSMTGVRKEIGKSVVHNILDTLTDNDYVAALKFSNVVKPINPCFDSLVQANKKNIMEIKQSLNTVKTSEFVNFTAALVEAFNLLQTYNRSGLGSQCNQAIMLITDGAPNTYEDTFRQYNWPNIPVRVFTYLIGRDVTANNEVYWMACHNRGYYTHVSNLAEVHEQVQKYIPVMSRPIVLSGERIFSWTPVYAPTSELELNDWVWENKQSYEIISRLRAQASVQTQALQSDPNANEVVQDNDPGNTGNSEMHRDKRQTMQVEHTAHHGENSAPAIKRKVVSKRESVRSKQEKKFALFTTLSTPVFDTRNYTNITKRILIKNVYQDSDIETIRIANLLGVAGIDVPIKEIEKLTPSFKLGVNGYAFMISNNGYLLNHPDLRPMYEGFLKPFYNSVDMSEVELANNTLGPRAPDSDIEAVRGNMINRTHGWKKVAVKIHIDGMKRVITRVNHYTHGMIGFSPFSLAIALPEPYGSYRLTSQVDLRMKHRVENFTNYFRGNQWRVHPEWAYCDSPHRVSESMPLSAEESIIQFLSKDLEKQTFRWRTSSIRPQVYETISCDKDLIQSLVLDAKLTDISNDKCNSNPNFRDEQRIKTFGIVTTFVATRSGLTRFKDYRSKEEIQMLEEVPFYQEHNRAIEETYYRRAVDFYNLNKDAFVYSVDFDAGEEHYKRNQLHSHSSANFLITATHALFIGNGKQSTPVSVVGIQFRYHTLHEFFLNATNKFNVPCTHLDVDCYLVDNNAFVVLSNHKVADVGKFLGQVDGDILDELVNGGVYRRVRIYDYQAICLDPIVPSGPSAGPFVFSLVRRLFGLMSHVFTTLAAIYVHVLYDGAWSIDAATVNSDGSVSYVRQDNWMDSNSAGGVSGASNAAGFEPFYRLNRTQARPCDKQFDLYEMMDFSNFTRSKEVTCGQNVACTKKFVAQYIPHTNLILVLIVNNPSCDCQKKVLSIEPTEVSYTEQERCRLLRTEKYRKRPTTCHNYHPQEKDIRQCGGAWSLYTTSAHQLRTITSSVILLIVGHTVLYRLYSALALN